MKLGFRLQVPLRTCKRDLDRQTYQSRNVQHQRRLTWTSYGEPRVVSLGTGHDPRAATAIIAEIVAPYRYRHCDHIGRDL